MFATAVALGLTDVDALTISTSRNGVSQIPLDTAAVAIGIGVLANTFLKLGVALFFGSARFQRLTAATLLGMAAAAMLCLAVG